VGPTTSTGPVPSLPRPPKEEAAPAPAAEEGAAAPAPPTGEEVPGAPSAAGEQKTGSASIPQTDVSSSLLESSPGHVKEVGKVSALGISGATSSSQQELDLAGTGNALSYQIQDGKKSPPHTLPGQGTHLSVEGDGKLVQSQDPELTAKESSELPSKLFPEYPLSSSLNQKNADCIPVSQHPGGMPDLAELLSTRLPEEQQGKNAEKKAGGEEDDPFLVEEVVEEEGLGSSL